MGFETITGPDCVCCDRSGGGGGGCTTGTITVCASQSCNAALPGDGTVNKIPGVVVTITETFSPFTVFIGTTDATGCFTQGGLSPGTYTVGVSFGGTTQSGSVTINSICQPANIGFTFNGSVLGLEVTGCGSSGRPTGGCTTTALPGVSITVVQSGTTIGTATTGSNGRAYVYLTRPSNGTNFTITYSLPTYFNDVIVTLSGLACTDNVSMNNGFSGGGTGVGGGTVAGYVCCWGPIPFKTTLNATVSGIGAITLTWSTGSLWLGCVTKTVNGANFSCTAAIPSLTTAFFVGWTCGTMSVSTRVCSGGAFSGKASQITCADLASTNASVSSLQDTSSTCDPLFDFGTFPTGSIIGGLDVSGAWSLSE